MMPGRRQSDAADLVAGVTAAGTLLLILLMGWASIIFAAATSWAFFVHVLRWWGVA